MNNLVVPRQRQMSGLNPLTEKQLRDAQRDFTYIFNTSSREYRVMGPNRIYTIPACPKGEEVSEALVIPGYVYTTGVKRVIGVATEFEWIAIDGIDVARDLVGTGPFKDHSENLTRWGVFLSSEPNPAFDQIAAARQTWFDRCDEKVREADGAFAINGGRVDIGGGRTASNIGPDHIEAAEVLGVSDSRPWASKNPKMALCDSCGVSCRPGLAFCPNGCIMDEVKARKAKPWLFQEQQRGPGRPPKELVA